MNYKSLKAKTDRFLACKVIAVVGVSQNPNEPVNANYRKLQDAGYTVVPVNPNYEQFEDCTCYPTVGEIPGIVEAALIFTHPKVTPKVIEECCAAGIKNIWIHKGMGGGSTSGSATQYLKERPEINFIDGACPMMFITGADWFHKTYRSILSWTNGLPD